MNVSYSGLATRHCISDEPSVVREIRLASEAKVID